MSRGSRHCLNAPVLQLPPDAHLQAYDTVVNHPIPSVSYGSFKMYKISAPDHHNVSHRHSLSFASTTSPFTCLSLSPSVHFNDLLQINFTVTEGMVSSLYQGVICSFFGSTCSSGGYQR